MIAKVLWTIGIAAGLFFFGFGARDAWKQHQKITASKPVEVTVISAKTVKHVTRGRRGRKSVKFEPVLEYRYLAGGREHLGHGVLPWKERGSLQWASGIVKRFKPGSVCQGYYVPGEVYEAFLIRLHSFEPYLRMMLPAGVIALALFIAQFFWRRPPEPPVPRADSWFEVPPSKSVGAKVAVPLAIAAFWHGAALIILGHYFLVAAPGSSERAALFTWIYEAVGLLPVASAVYFQLVRRSVANAQVLMLPAEPRVGGNLAVRVEQEAQRDLEVREARVGVVCHETRKVKSGTKTTISTGVHCQHWETALQERSVYRGDILKAEVRLPIPAGGQPSTPPAQKGYPRYRWSIALQVKLAGSPDYRAEFPITVGDLQPGR